MCSEKAQLELTHAHFMRQRAQIALIGNVTFALFLATSALLNLAAVVINLTTGEGGVLMMILFMITAPAACSWIVWSVKSAREKKMWQGRIDAIVTERKLFPAENKDAAVDVEPSLSGIQGFPSN